MTRRSILHATPMTFIVLGVVVLHTVGLGWGLPASDGWDNDGVAPRDFLPGLAETFDPGHFYTYPPVHLALLAVLTLPLTLAGVARAPSTALGDIVHELLSPGYMTSIAYVARVLSMTMSIGIVLLTARIAEEMRAHELGVAPDRTRVRWLEGDFTDERVRRVGWCTAAVIGLEATLTYYAHTTNLDVPYLFWGMLGLVALSRAVARDEPRRLRLAFVFATLAVGTKDQAYALFGLSIPVVLALARPRLKEVAVAAAIAVLVFLVVDGVVFNPTGFRARVAFLRGSASQDFVEYTRDWSGRVALLVDAGERFSSQFPKLAAPLFLLGGFRAIAPAVQGSARRRRLAVALLPLLVGVSFTVLFNWAALRTNARFLLPQALMLGVYGGIGVESLLFAERAGLRHASRAVLLVPLVLALHACVSVDVSFLFDPRYDAEAWMREHIPPGAKIETYGLNVYLPRFPPDRSVTRVGPEPVRRRNPMPGVAEVEGAFEDALHRDARFIVVSEAWVWRYLVPPDPALAEGRRLSPNVKESASEPASTLFFKRLVWGHEDFELVHPAEYRIGKWFPIVDVHGNSGREIWVYERKPVADQNNGGKR
ncbi:MAG: hypothetical protein U0270_01515 [Labilithrix sp.]